VQGLTRSWNYLVRQILSIFSRRAYVLYVLHRNNRLCARARAHTPPKHVLCHACAPASDVEGFNGYNKHREGTHTLEHIHAQAHTHVSLSTCAHTHAHAQVGPWKRQAWWLQLQGLASCARHSLHVWTEEGAVPAPSASSTFRQRRRSGWWW